LDYLRTSALLELLRTSQFFKFFRSLICVSQTPFSEIPVPFSWKRLLLFALGAAICVLVYLFLLNFPGLRRQDRTGGLVAVLAIAAGTWWLTTRFLRADGMSLSDLGLGAGDSRLAHLGVGFLAGSVLTGVWIAIVTVFSSATWHPNPGFRGITLLTVCAFDFFNNVGEELVYRGYAFVRLADRFGPIVTVVATSILFGLLHLQSGIPWLSVVAGVLTSGLVFGAIFARWRSVPLALGFHVATNIVQDASGLRTSAASLFAPAFPPTAVESSTLILAGIALVNVLLAVGILATARRPRPLERWNASHPD
jgi:membrane protease YdiL (CAAX protease family)